MKSYVPAFFHIWPCHKKGQSQLKVTFCIIFVVLKCSMLHIKFQGYHSTGPVKVLPYTAIATIFVMWPRPIILIFCSISHRSFHIRLGFKRPYIFWRKIRFNFETWVALGKVKEWPLTFGTHVTSTHAWLYYKLTYEPQGINSPPISLLAETVCGLFFLSRLLGPVVQSIVSLTSSFRGQLVKCFMTL